MKYAMVLMVFAALFIGCGGNETMATGGHGGESVTTSTEGGGGGSAGMGGSGGEGGCSMANPSGCHFPSEYTLDPAVEVDDVALFEALADDPNSCRPFIPGDNEDQSWTRIVMNPPPDKYNYGRFVISDDPEIGIVPQSGGVWNIAVAIIGKGLDPNQFGCDSLGDDRPVYEIGGVALTNPMTGADSFMRVLEFEHPEAEIADGNKLLYCLRNTVYPDGTRTGVVACGPNTCKVGRDQWEDNDTPPFSGAINEMGDYGPSYCVSWEVTAIQ